MNLKVRSKIKKSNLLLLIVASLAFSSPHVLAQEPLAVTLAKAPRILIQNAEMVITMDPDLGKGTLGILDNADVLMENDKIVKVGTGIQAADAVIINAEGQIVMPGFVDVHNHLWQSMIRGCGADKDLIGWLNSCVFPLYGPPQPSEHDAYTAVRLSTADLINTGVTTVVDSSHSFTAGFSRGNVQALIDSQLRFIYSYCGKKDSFDEMKDIKTKIIDPNPLATFQVCSHPSKWTIDWLGDTTKLAKEMDSYLNVHLLENIKEVADQPIQALGQVGAFQGKVLANHVIHISPEEIALLAKHDVRISHNPVSNMRLASGIMPLPEIKKAGLKIGLGLDGGANDTSDAFANMKAAIGLQRAKHLTTDIYPAVDDVLRMATLGGAEVLDLEDRIGSLTSGKQADLLIINPNNINFAPRFNLPAQIVFNGRPSNVDYVFVAGKPLKVEGSLLIEDQDELIRDLQEVSDRIKNVLQGQK